MGFVNRIVWIFTSPTRVFDDIRENRVRWVEPWIAVSVVTMLVTWLGLPIQRVFYELNPHNLPPEQLDKQIEIVTRFGLVQVLLTPLGVIVLSLVVTGLAYILVTILSRTATFRQFFTLMMFTSIVSSVGQLLTTSIVRLRGLDAIQTADDMHMSLSLRFLAPESSPALKGLFSSFDFFIIWALLLLIVGLMRVFDMKRNTAVAAVIPIWVIYTAALIMGEVFGKMS
jgi:membrane protein, antimicrobial resistance system